MYLANLTWDLWQINNLCWPDTRCSAVSKQSQAANGITWTLKLRTLMRTSESTPHCYPKRTVAVVTPIPTPSLPLRKRIIIIPLLSIRCRLTSTRTGGNLKYQSQTLNLRFFRSRCRKGSRLLQLEALWICYTWRKRRSLATWSGRLSMTKM